MAKTHGNPEEVEQEMSKSGSFGSCVGNHGGEVRRDRGSDVFS